MEPHIYLSSGNKVSNDSSMSSANLDDCAEAWLKYKESLDITNNLLNWLYRMLSNQMQYFSYDKKVDSIFESDIATKSKSLSSSFIKYKNYSHNKLASSEFHFANESILLVEQAKEFFNSSNSSLAIPSKQNTTLEQESLQLEALSEQWQIYLAVLYSLTAVTSFLLNIMTVIVLARGRRSELKKYLINLSVSDLLMSLFSIPFTYTEYMLGRWVFAAFLCPLVRLMVTLSVFVSVATMTVIGINRYLAIMHPLGKKKSLKLPQWTIGKNHVIMGIWLIGIAISFPEFLMHSIRPFCFNKQLYFDCRENWPNSVTSLYSVILYICTFVIPLSLLSYLYTCIGLKLWRRQMPGNVDAHRDLNMQTQRVKVIKMLFVVVIMFAISWLPLQTFSMIMFLYPNIRDDYQYRSFGYNIFIGTYFSCHWLSMAHSCLNPLIYCYMNDKFRADLQALICWRKTINISCNSLVSNNNNNNNNNNNSKEFAAASEFALMDEQINKLNKAADEEMRDQRVRAQVELDFNQVGNVFGPTAAAAAVSINTSTPTSCKSEIVHFEKKSLGGGARLQSIAEDSSLRQAKLQANCPRLSVFYRCIYRLERVRSATQRAPSKASQKTLTSSRQNEQQQEHQHRHRQHRFDTYLATCSGVQLMATDEANAVRLGRNERASTGQLCTTRPPFAKVAKCDKLVAAVKVDAPKSAWRKRNNLEEPSSSRSNDEDEDEGELLDEDHLSESRRAVVCL